MPQPGDRIKAIRGQRNWTQEELAEAAGISKSFLSDIENGQAQYQFRIGAQDR